MENLRSPICQSCGMPMKKDEDFGTNDDNSFHKEYCHYCFKEGEFTEPDLTLEQEINKVAGIAVEQLGMTEEQAKKMAVEIIPRLKRWVK